MGFECLYLGIMIKHDLVPMKGESTCVKSIKGGKREEIDVFHVNFIATTTKGDPSAKLKGSIGSYFNDLYCIFFNKFFFQKFFNDSAGEIHF